MIRIYTDGSARGNPGKAGWGAIIIDETKKTVIELGGHVDYATNNQMELRAVLEGLSYVRKSTKIKNIAVYTDSMYVIQGMKQWTFAWQKNSWKTSKNERVLNVELWQDLVQSSEGLQIEWLYVPAHVGVPLNERADTIATMNADKIRETLFDGALHDYAVDTKEAKYAEPVKKINESKKATKGYYISVIKGVMKRYETWDACEKDVKGVKAVKFKKVTNEAEEKIFLKSIGL